MEMSHISERPHADWMVRRFRCRRCGANLGFKEEIVKRKMMVVSKLVYVDTGEEVV